MTDTIEIAKLRLDGGTQPRAEMNLVVIAEYAEAMKDGAVFPAVTVFHDGASYWLADGFHRVKAHETNAETTIRADIRQGTQRDAILFSLSANADHGLRRTNADKRRAVECMLHDSEWVKWSDHEIARRCRVTHPFVNKLRKEPSLVTVTSERTYTTKHGTVATMNTANIGKDPVVDFCLANGIEETDKVNTWQQIAAQNPKFFEEAKRGYITNPDGEDIPVEKADATLIRVASDEDEYERWQRHQTYKNGGAPKALQMSVSNEWYTPTKYIEAARALMGGIDTDPASNPIANNVVKAATYYTIETNGLDKPWKGRVWLNPPYGREDGESNQDRWSARLIEQYKAGVTTEAVLLVNAVTDRAWFQPLWNYTICFTDHRIKFYDENGEAGQPTHGNCFVYFGSQVSRFAELFSEFGVIVQRLPVLAIAKTA